MLIGSANVEITKKDIDEEDITVTPYSGEYDGENHSISVVDADGGNVTYSTSETGEYTTGNPAYKNAGSYTVYYKVDRGLNYNVLKGSSTVEIIKLNIAAEDITVIPYNDEYDGESHSISASDANEGTITYSTSEDGEYTADNPAYKNAGSYTVYYKVDRGTNYNVLKGSSTVEIDFREVTLKGITITDKTYDGTADATSNVTGAYLDGVIEGDDVVLDSSDMTAMFNDENVNNDKPVSISGYALSGEKASQYNLIQPEGITGNIISETSSDMNISIDRVVAEETDYNGEWTGSNVTITLRGDAPSGIEKYQYTTDGGLNWADFTDAFLLIEETTDKIYAFRAISNGGINSDSSDTVTVKIDKVKPVIQSIEGNPATPKNTSQIITFEIFEENSGIDSSTLTVSKDGANIEIKHEDGKYSFIADANGKYDINVSDNAGNAADTEAVEVNKLDFEKPVISSLIPANNAQQVDTGLLTAIFNEDVMKATDGIDGDITIFNSNGAVLERINIKNNRIKASENQVDIYLTKPLKPGTEYYVTIDSGIIYDIAGNSFAGIADSAVWRFRTSNANINNSIIGINVSVIGEQYKAIVDPSDETVYSVTAKPYEDGLVKVKITPVFLKNAEAVITTEDAGVEVDGNIVTITDIDREIANVKIQVKNADGSIDENKIYTLIIHRGSLETKVTKSGMSVDAVADNLRGAVDVSSDISDGKQMELELEIADNGNIVSESQKLEIENFLEGQSVAMYLEIDLKLKNITNDTETLIENTQNPVKIKIEIPENMRGGRDYKVIRVHKGVIEILDTVLEGNYLVFETDRFSQYAISYKIYNEKDESDNSNQVVEKHIAYIKGYEDETFRPENNITRAEAATIIARLSPAYDELKYYINVYGDVDAQAWYANTVSFGAQNKLILGYEDGSFRPDSSITRAELVSIIARFNNIDPKDESELRFEDASGHWAEGNISALYKLGWINGYEDGSFRPDAAITRAEAVKIINASLGRTPVKERVDLNISKYFVRFTDISVNHWAYYDILESSITHAVEDFN